MKRLTMFAALVAAVALGGCAAPSSAMHHGAEPVAGSPAPRLEGAAARAVALPIAAGPGEPREVHVLVDEPALKLVTIVLRRGTVLPEHRSPVPVTIQALEGAGTVSAGGERLRIDAGNAVVLHPGVPHSVEPEAGTDLVLLVHHLGGGEEAHP